MRCDGAASGSRPCTSGSSYEAWLQWTTTSSPGFQRVTPSPTFQTTPEASEPPMWWSSAWERNTDTGLPSAAHTLLKFTPAAITRTVTSNAPGSGNSISSSWKASVGSPSRSARMTQAAIVGGRSPGSTSSWEIWEVSTDMAGGYRPSEPLVALEPKEREQDHSRHHEPADAPDGERAPALDVVDQPGEVLAEE